MGAARNHYHGLREALPDLKGVALFDRLDRETSETDQITCLVWRRREIENYLCSQATLEAYARASAEADAPGPLLAIADVNRRLYAMRESIVEIQQAMETLDMGSPWSASAKVSDDFLTPLFRTYFQKLNLPNLMSKKAFYGLAEHVPEDEIDAEVREKLDAIACVAESASPRMTEY